MIKAKMFGNYNSLYKLNVQKHQFVIMKHNNMLFFFKTQHKCFEEFLLAIKLYEKLFFID